MEEVKEFEIGLYIKGYFEKYCNHCPYIELSYARDGGSIDYPIYECRNYEICKRVYDMSLSLSRRS